MAWHKYLLWSYSHSYFFFFLQIIDFILTYNVEKYCSHQEWYYYNNYIIAHSTVYYNHVLQFCHFKC